MTEAEKERFYIELGRNIRQAREKAGLKQDAFAKLISLTRASVVNLEKGRQHSPLHLLYDIAKVLGVSIHAIIPGENTIAHPVQNEASAQLEEKIRKSLGEKSQSANVDINKIKSFIIENTPK